MRQRTSSTSIRPRKSPCSPPLSPTHPPPSSIKPKKSKAPAAPKATAAKPKGPTAKASTAAKPKPATTKPANAKTKAKEASGPNHDTGYVPSPSSSYRVVYDDSMYYLIQFKLFFKCFFYI
jgi:hypothetical protein